MRKNAPTRAVPNDVGEITLTDSLCQVHNHDPITAIHDPTPASIRCRERQRRHWVNALTRVLRWRCGPGG